MRLVTFTVGSSPPRTGALIEGDRRVLDLQAAYARVYHGASPLLHKDLGLIYCHSGELKNGRAELLEAQKLLPADPEVISALRILDSLQK